MLHKEIVLQSQDVHKLLSAADADAALLYLYIAAGNAPAQAGQELHISQGRLAVAEATLRQLGLWPQEKKVILPGERPAYTENDVLHAMGTDGEFQALQGEIQRVLGRTLNTEELKILLGMHNYLGFGPDVLSVLVSYCRDRARQMGRLRPPSLRSMEKEAYLWAEKGIETMEEAVSYIRRENLRRSKLGRLKQILQLSDRNFTPTEEKYAQSWLEMGFQEDALALAYDRTCTNTGTMKWAYMNGILKRWHEAGLHTKEEICSGDRKATDAHPQRDLDDRELAAIARMFQEDR